MTRCVFVQIRCKPGTAYKVADQIVLREKYSALYSTSGPFDLLVQIYVPDDEDIGKYINDNVYTDVTVDSAGESQINLNITISPSVTARGSVSSDNNTGVGIFFERDY